MEDSKFEGVIAYLVAAIISDYRDSPYGVLSNYWDDHYKYWREVFSEDCYLEICKQITG